MKHTSLYSPHPSIAMVQKSIAELKQKTDRSLDEWLKHIKADGPKGGKELREWLKSECGLGTNYSSWLAAIAEGRGNEWSDPKVYLEHAVEYVDRMFVGKRAALRPIYDALLKLSLGVGNEAKACPCQTIVPIYRKHVFAQIKPTTQTRIDFGFALGGLKASGRLIDTGGFAKKDRITHRIPIASLDDIDDEVNRWLKAAYDLDA